MVFPVALVALPVMSLRAQGVAEPDARTAELMARYDNRTKLIRPCPVGAPGEIVVCGRPANQQQRYRLPLPVTQDGAPLLPGEAPRASAAPLRQGGCGIVRGDPTLCNLGLTVLKLSF